MLRTGDRPEWRLASTLQSAAGNYAALVKSGLPVAYWRLGDKGAKPLAADASGFGHAGTYQNGVLLGQPGALSLDNNTAITFDGVNGFVAIPDHNDFNGGKPISIEAWIKVSSFTRTWQAIVTKGDSSWRLHRFGNSQHLAFGTSGLSNVDLEGTKNVDDNQWHHVVAVFDGENKFIYVDGELDVSVNVTGNLASNKSEVRLGENAEATDRYFNGWLYEVAIYKRALSAGEVADHYQAGGGAALRTKLNLNFSRLATVELKGSLKPNGAIGLSASSLNLNLCGFEFKDASLLFANTPGAVATLSGLVTFNNKLFPTTPLGKVLEFEPRAWRARFPLKVRQASRYSTRASASWVIRLEAWISISMGLWTALAC